MAFSVQSRHARVTAVVDTWPYSIAEIERAVLSVKSVAERVMIIVPDVVSDYTLEDFSGMGSEVIRIPFFGNFTTVRNWVMTKITTPWVLLVFGNEVLLAEDAKPLLAAVFSDRAVGYRLKVATSDRGPVLAHPVRLLPSTSQVRFVGRIWPEVSGSLIEFGYGLDTLDVRLLREEDRGSSGSATAWLRASLNTLTEANPRHWRAQLAQAVLAWAEHRHQESRHRLDILPKNLTGETRLIADGLAALLWQEEAHHERAWASIQRLVQQYPRRADFWALAGESLWQLKRPQEARAALVRCLQIGERPVPHLPPGYASYTARLKVARAEIATHQLAPGLAHLLNLIEEYPGYRAAWQEVLSHLRDVPVEEVFSAMSTVIAPSKIRQFCMHLTSPTEDERRLAEWLESLGFDN